MSAAFPANIATFSTKVDITDVVFADHVNSMQVEIVAIETALGQNPAQGTAGTATYTAAATAFATVSARIANLEAGVKTAVTGGSYVSTAGGSTIAVGAANIQPLAIRGFTGQTADYLSIETTADGTTFTPAVRFRATDKVLQVNLIEVTDPTAVGLTTGTVPFRVGTGTAANLSIGRDTLQAQNNAVAAVLNLNPAGGQVNVNGKRALTTDDLVSGPAPAMPTGSLAMYGANTAPAGWLLCDGTAVSRATYSALFGVVGSTYGAGDGSTTFNLPDMRSKFPMGKATLAAAPTAGGVTSHGHYNGTGAHGHSDGGHAHAHSALHSHTVGDHSHGLTDHSHGFTGTSTATGTQNVAHGHSGVTTGSGNSGGMNASNPHAHDHTPVGSIGNAGLTSTAALGSGQGTSTASPGGSDTSYASLSNASLNDYGATTSNLPPFWTFNFIIKT